MRKCIWTYLVPGERSGLNASYRIGIQSMLEYAMKTNADFIIHRQPMFPGFSCFYERFAVAKQAAHYDRVLALGADIVIRQDAPNIFEEFPKGTWALNETKAHPSTPHGQRFLDHIFSIYGINKSTDATTPMWNSCVLLTDGKLLDTIYNFRTNPHDWWHDLSPYNANIHESGIEMGDLGYKWNAFASRVEWHSNIRDCHFMHFDNFTKTGLGAFESYACAIKNGPYLTRQVPMGCIKTS